MRPACRADKRAEIAYLRVSTAEQASNGDSLAIQRQQIAGYAMMRGWPEPEWFIDRGVSGSAPFADRPEGKRLLETAGKGEVIITAKLDRAFRNAADALATLEELKDLGGRLAHDRPRWGRHRQRHQQSDLPQLTPGVRWMAGGALAHK